MLLRSQDGLPLVTGGELRISRVRDHTQPPARMSGPGIGGPGRALALSSACLPSRPSHGLHPRAGCGSAMSRGPRLPCSFHCLVWNRGGFLLSTLGLPAQEARFSTLLPPTSKSWGSAPPSAPSKLLWSQDELCICHVCGHKGVSALPVCPRDRSLRRANHTPVSWACPTALTPGHRRDTGDGEEGPREPACVTECGRPGRGAGPLRPGGSG